MMRQIFRRCLRIGFLVALVLMSAVRSSSAADPGDALIDRGLKLMMQGKPEQALQQFQKAQEVSPGPRALAQIGLAYQALEQWPEAEDFLGFALEASTHPWIVRNLAPLERALADVRAQIGKIEISGPGGAEILINGRPQGTLPLARPVRLSVPGLVTIRAALPGHEEYARTVAVDLGRTVAVTIALKALPPPAPRPAPELAATPKPLPAPARRGNGLAWLGTGLLAAGGLGMVTGAYLFGLDGKGSCTDRRSVECPNLYDTKVQAGVVGGLGLVSAGVGAFLLASAWNDLTASTARVSVAASGAGVWLHGQF